MNVYTHTYICAYIDRGHHKQCKQEVREQDRKKMEARQREELSFEITRC